jgi:glutamate/tyrosine decarboxylase-like PLP-dependent enzyme
MGSHELRWSRVSHLHPFIPELMGRGYKDACWTIVSAARLFAEQVNHRFSEDLYILGDPKVSVVAFGSKKLNIYIIGDRMSKRGWHLNALQNPAALHMAFTVRSIHHSGNHG